MRALVIVKGFKALERFLGLPLGAGTFNAQALLIERAVKTFHIGILFWMLRIADIHLNAQTTAKPQQGGTKITALGTAHKAGIAIQRNLPRHAPALHSMYQRFNHRLSRKVTADLGM